MYEDGVGAEADLERALDYIRQAAETGDAGAQFIYGVKLINLPAKKEKNEGLKLILDAASKDNRYANLFCAEMYVQGGYGFKKDKALSRYFFDRTKNLNSRLIAGKNPISGNFTPFKTTDSC